MSVTGRIIGTAGGWLLARWDGAILGFFIGSIADSALSGGKNTTAAGGTSSGAGAATATYSADFNMVLLSLSAAVMQSDGITTRSELDYVKNFLVSQFGLERTKRSLLILRDLLKKNIALENVCSPVRQNMSYNGRLELLHYLFGIAKADGQISAQERAVLNRIAYMIGIRASDFSSITAMFAPTDNSVAYQILGISPDATADEIKKAYRQKAMEAHPDRVGHLGEELRQSAEEKFKKIQAAYEEIKKNRGLQ